MARPASATDGKSAPSIGLLEHVALKGTILVMSSSGGAMILSVFVFIGETLSRWLGSTYPSHWLLMIVLGLVDQYFGPVLTSRGQLNDFSEEANASSFNLRGLRNVDTWIYLNFFASVLVGVTQYNGGDVRIAIRSAAIFGGFLHLIGVKRDLNRAHDFFETLGKDKTAELLDRDPDFLEHVQQRMLMPWARGGLGLGCIAWAIVRWGHL